MPLKSSSSISFKKNLSLHGKFFPFFLLAVFLFFSFQKPALSGSATSDQAMVVTQHPLATDAALRILRDGGNAADAAITAQLVLNVVEPQGSGLGGGGFFLYYDRIQRSVTSYDGREAAPASARPDMFLRDGHPIPFFPDRVSGGLSVGVPGTPALIQKIYDKNASGVFSLSELAEPAAKLAEEGVPVSKSLAGILAEHADRLRQFPETEKIFFRDGAPLREGETLVQTDLAETLRLLGEQKSEIFYRGEIGEAIMRAVSSSPVNSAVLTKTDLESYAVIKRDPVYGNYRGFDILAPGLPTSGGIVLLEALKILEHFELAELGWDSEALHLVTEAQKLAFLDRSYLGDTANPQKTAEEILSQNHIQKRIEQIKPQKALRWDSLKADEGLSTTHISVMDRSGNLVSWTSTIEGPFGSGLTVPGYGFLLNNQLTDFEAEPFDENGNLKANAAEPRKRPLSSTTPAFVFRNGNPYLVVGSPGGRTIIGTVLNIILNSVDFSMSCEEAVAKERLIFRGDQVEMELLLFHHPFIRLQLELWGHDVKENPSIGNAQVICFDSKYQRIVGVADPRGEGSASGY